MYESSTESASNSLAHEDLGHLRKPIIGIYKPSSIMKIPTSIWKWQHRRLSMWKTCCYFEAQVWKRIVTLPLLSFSLIFFHGSFLPLFFSFFSFFFVRSLIPTCGGIMVSIILSSLGQCSNNDDHHTFIYLQLKITTRYKNKYDSIWMPLAVYQDVQWSSIAKIPKNGQAMKISC